MRWFWDTCWAAKTYQGHVIYWSINLFYLEDVLVVKSNFLVFLCNYFFIVKVPWLSFYYLQVKLHVDSFRFHYACHFIIIIIYYVFMSTLSFIFKLQLYISTFMIFCTPSFNIALFKTKCMPKIFVVPSTFRSLW